MYYLLLILSTRNFIGQELSEFSAFRLEPLLWSASPDLESIETNGKAPSSFIFIPYSHLSDVASEPESDSASWQRTG